MRVYYTVVDMKTGQIVVRVEPRLKEMFEKQCEALGLKPSETVRDLMLAFVRLEPGRKLLTGEEPLTRDLTVADYFSMSEKERDDLWKKWYREAERETDYVEFKVSSSAASRR